MTRILVVLVTALLVLPSCATLFAKDTRSVMITSSPPGATITVNGREAGQTPTRLSVNNHEKLAVTLRKEGFHPGGCYINTSIDAIWVIADVILIATIAPLVVDILTGDWSSLKSEFCSVNLLPMAA